MKKASLLALMLVAAMPWNAWAEESPEIYVVELAVFTCPYCKALEAHTGALSMALGDHFVFAPVVVPGRFSPGAKVYYALRDEVNPRLLRGKIFMLIQTMRFSPQSMADIVQWLRIQGLQFDAEQALQEAEGPLVARAVDRAVRLAVMAGVSAVPALIVVADGEVVAAYEQSRASTGARIVDKVLNKVEQLKAKG